MIVIIKKLIDKELANLQVTNWPIWEKEVSEFKWHYDDTEHCYFLEGKVIVEAYGNSYEITKGDFVTFPKGMDCVWKIIKPVKKHYTFL